MTALRTYIMPSIMITLGVLIVVQTIRAGATSPLAKGFLLGGGVTIVGVLRLWLGLRMERED